MSKAPLMAAFEARLEFCGEKCLIYDRNQLYIKSLSWWGQGCSRNGLLPGGAGRDGPGDLHGLCGDGSVRMGRPRREILCTCACRIHLYMHIKYIGSNSAEHSSTSLGFSHSVLHVDVHHWMWTHRCRHAVWEPRPGTSGCHLISILKI